MRREIDHPADIAFEICFSDYDELFKDFISIFFDLLQPKLHENSEKKFVNYKFTNKLFIEDILFDIGNDFILRFHQMLFPTDFHISKTNIRIEFSKVYEFENPTPIKAVAYPKMKKRNCLQIILDI